MRIQRGFNQLLLVLICCCSSGCASFLTNSSSKEFANAKDPHKGVIVGKLRTTFPVNSTIIVRNVVSGKIYNIVSESTANDPDKQGYLNLFFCVQLPEGVYSVDSIETENDNFRSSPIDVNVKFKVIAGRVQYFSTLVIEKEIMMHMGNYQSAQMRLRWKDEYSAAQEELKDQCPWLEKLELIKH